MSEDTFIAAMGMLTGVVMVLGLPLVIVYARKIWMRDSASRGLAPTDSDHRLERIEQAIDAMAVEVERVSESQRFMTKLLSDRAQERVGISASPSRHEG